MEQAATSGMQADIDHHARQALIKRIRDLHSGF
jgi:hypothetical protein